MFRLITLILLTFILNINLKKIFQKKLLQLRNKYKEIEKTYNKLGDENTKLKEETAILEKTATETIALYDITKEICKYLDVEKLFSCFKEQLNKYISVADCKFLKGTPDPSSYGNYIIMPLKINQGYSPGGYLVAGGVRDEEREKFSILANQFILGVKRVLLYQQVQELAITDSLTGIFSRRHYLERFNEELQRSKKFNYCLSFLMLDIDNFKDCNDRYGHLVGDVILKEISQRIRENIRQIDILGRYGGEEFSIVLTEIDKQEAVVVAERIRRAVENSDIKAYDEEIKVTISIGISTFPTDAKSPEAIIEQADQALYQAKQMGRNRVCVYTNQES